MSKQQNKKFWAMTKNKATNSAEISIYGTIGSSWWDESISASQFSRDLKDLGDDLEEITVRINSAGGSVFDGLAIRSMLRNHKATINVHVDGWAASIASIIAMAGDKITMSKGSMMMIHNPSNSLWGGQAKDFRDMADILDKIRDSLVSVYAEKTGMEYDELVSLLDAETWMSAEEAVEKGFADTVEGGTAVAASMMGAVAMVNGVQMDYSRFKHMPILPQAAAQSDQTPAKEHENNNNQREDETPMDLNEFKAKYPDLYKDVLNTGVTQERGRITELNALATAPGAAEIVAKAIAEGKTAGEAAMEIVKASAARIADEGQRRANDAKNSGANGVTPDEAPLTPDPEAVSQAEANALAEEIKNLVGGRK